MPLNPTDRANFSKAIVETDLKVAVFDQTIAAIQKELTSATSKDNSNKTLTDQTIVLVQAYQKEKGLLDGGIYVNLSSPATDYEAILQASAAQVASPSSGTAISGNLLYPNTSASPSFALRIANPTQIGVTAIANNIISGRRYDETLPSAGTTEASLITAVDTAITDLTNKFLNQERSTFQRASASGSCTVTSGGSPPGGAITDPICTGSGGTWTPGSDTIYSAPVAAIATEATDVANAVTNLKTRIQDEIAAIAVDTNPTRAAQNAAATTSLNNLLSAINAWQAFTDYNVYSGTATSAAFYSHTPSSASKYRDTELSNLQSALSTRSAYITTRQSQLSTNIGSVSQNSTTGVVTGSGLQKNLYDYTSLRLSLIGGSLLTVYGLQRGIAAQQSLKAQAIAESTVYQTLLTCSAFSAPSNGTNFVSVKSASGFNVADSLYLISDTRPEITRTVAAISGNRIEFTQPVPEAYFNENFARVYKDLT